MSTCVAKGSNVPSATAAGAVTTQLTANIPFNNIDKARVLWLTTPVCAQIFVQDNSPQAGTCQPAWPDVTAWSTHRQLTFPVKLFAAGHVENFHVDGHQDAGVLESVVLPQLLQSEVPSPHLGKRRGLVALGRVRHKPPAPPPVHQQTHRHHHDQNTNI